MLGYPSIDPHGSPIPDLHGKMRSITRIPLSEVPDGKTVRLTGLTQSGDDFLKFLNTKKIKLGVSIKVIKKEAFDGSMKLSINKDELSLSEIVCKQLLVV